MSKRKGLLIGIVGFLVLCCGLSGLGSLFSGEDPGVEPTTVVIVEADDRAQTITLEPANTIAPTSIPTEASTSIPTDEPTNTPEPSATSTRTPRPTATSTPTPEIQTATIVDPTGNEVVGEMAVVTHIVDGDTIDVEINGEVYRVRYIGMDTPERGDSFFQEATDANAQLVAGQKVVLVKDVSETDRYDRLLRYVYLEDGTFVNGELVRLGFAQASSYPPDVALQEIITSLQRAAVNSGAGLWASPAVVVAPTNTAVPRPTSPPVQPTEAPQPTSPPAPPTDAPQPTQAPPVVAGSVVIVGVNKQAEYVDIQNQGGTDVDLSGWVLLSEKGSQACNLGGVIAGGQGLRIWAMASDAGNGGFNCGFGSNIWNNSESDPAVLFNAAGQEVSRW